ATLLIGSSAKPVLPLAMSPCTVSTRASVGRAEHPCTTRTSHGGSLHTIGNERDDRTLRILEGVKAADIWDVGQGHDGFGAQFLCLTRCGVDVVHGNIGTQPWLCASALWRDSHNATDSSTPRFHNGIGHARHSFFGPPQE